MNWGKVRKEYEKGRLTQTEISRLFCVPISTLRSRAKKEGWSRVNMKTSKHNKNTAPDNSPPEKLPDAGTKREQIISVADKLLSSISRAADELDRYAVKNKVRTKTVEYDSESGKAGCEVIREDEKLEEVCSIVDRVELKQLVTALKDISDIYENGKSDSGNRLEELIRGLCDDSGVQ